MNKHMENKAPVLEARGVTKSYTLGKRTIEILHGLDFQIYPGEFVAIVGPSGAGKSTLLHILGTLEKPTSGKLFVDGEDVAALDDLKKAEMRRRSLGFIFQFHHLLPGFSALENVMMPMRICGAGVNQAADPARELLEKVGVGHRLDNKPSELSGGEQQRVAVARAMINSPKVILADEPTGNLDRETGKILEDDLIHFARESQSAVIVVTHNERWAARADRVIKLVDGEIVGDGKQTSEMNGVYGG